MNELLMGGFPGRRLYLFGEVATDASFSIDAVGPAVHHYQSLHSTAATMTMTQWRSLLRRRPTTLVLVLVTCLGSLAQSFHLPAHSISTIPRRQQTTTFLSAVSSSSSVAHVALVSGSAESGYGKTSPEPNPSWKQVCDQLALRLPHFAGTLSDGSGADVIQTKSIEATEISPGDLKGQDIVLALGVCTPEEQSKLVAALDAAQDSLVAVLADPTCGASVRSKQKAGKYVQSSGISNAVASIIPWSATATGMRVLTKTNTLLERKSSEDYIFAVLFAIHGLGVATIDAVKSDLNPSWEKGPIRNAQEFKKMADCCGPQILAAISDPQTKRAIDMLNAVDLRDQVGSYRVIVSNETPDKYTTMINYLAPSRKAM